MRSATTVVAVLVLAQFLPGQDLKLREEAIRLLERANAVRSSPNLPNLERVDNFRVFLDSGTAEGVFTWGCCKGLADVRNTDWAIMIW